MKTLKTLLIAAALVAAPAIACAADLSGGWTINTKANGQDIALDCTFNQAGAALTGTCGLAGGQGSQDPLTGTVDGNNASWAYDIDFNGQKTHIAYTGQVQSPTSVTGDMQAFGATAPFTATKK